jgi:hypothetical protein
MTTQHRAATAEYLQAEVSDCRLLSLAARTAGERSLVADCRRHGGRAIIFP